MADPELRAQVALGVLSRCSCGGVPTWWPRGGPPAAEGRVRAGGWGPRMSQRALPSEQRLGPARAAEAQTVGGSIIGCPATSPRGGPEPRAPDTPIQLGGHGWGPVDFSAGHGGQATSQSQLQQACSQAPRPGVPQQGLCTLMAGPQAPYSVSGAPRITLACTNRVSDRKFSIIYSIKGIPRARRWLPRQAWVGK